MAELRMFTVKATYEVDIMAKVDEKGNPDTAGFTSVLESFGARHVALVASPYTGAGTHEFVGSTDPGLAHLAICVKCGKRKSEAAEKCPGVPK